MRNRALQNTLFGVVLAVWVASFFLPSINLGTQETVGGSLPGWKAAGLSATLLFTIEKKEIGFHLYYGSFWLANFFMLGSPLALWRARRGKALVFLALMTLWDLLCASFAGFEWWKTRNFGAARLGYWVWLATLFAMTAVLWASRRRQSSREIR